MNAEQKYIKKKKIILPGGAGLVGQNLVVCLKKQGFNNIVVLDKHIENVKILKKLQSDILIENVDLSERGEWEKHFENADIVIMLQAQIGASNYEPFQQNNINSTKNILKVMEQFDAPYLIHISSSVVNSTADDFYTRSKNEQEKLVLNSPINSIILRPTLMFGWFDRKHLGWLSRFMKKIPIFPVPGNGKYMRQPLYVVDFCNTIISCIKVQPKMKIFNITGLEKINYIDIIKKIKISIKSRSHIICIPYNLFYFLLKVWAIFDNKPPFTSDQLKALATHDEFEVIDWPKIFNIKPTKFDEAIDKTFNDKKYSQVILKF